MGARFTVFKRFFEAWRLLLAVAALAGIAVAAQGYGDSWQNDLWRALFAPTASPHSRVAVVEINDRTLAKFVDRSPIDRDFLADLIRKIALAQPVAIGIDILFDQASSPAKDDALKRALHTVRVPVVIAWAEGANTRGQVQLSQEQYLQHFLRDVDNPMVAPGLANLRADADGTIRRLALRAENGVVRSTMPLALARLAGATIPEGLEIPLAYFGHPTLERQMMRDNEPFFVFPAETLNPEVSAAWNIQSRVLRGRVVLVGANLAGIDQHRTPFAADVLAGPPTSSGLYILAHSVAQLLDGRVLALLPSWLTTLVTLLSIGFGVLLGASELPGWVRITSTAAMAVVLGAVSLTLFHFGGVSVPVPEPGPILPIVAPLFGLFGAVAVGVADARRRSASEKRFIRTVLTRYVPPAMVQRMLASPRDLKLGGERREISLVYSDIAGFTTLCETADPERLVPALNSYLDGMTRIIHARGGTVAGFIGDAILAFWGAPLDDPQQSEHALHAAVEMNCFARESRNRISATGLDFGLTRIGVHRGVVTVGNFGGPLRLEYMAHGDAVNAVARLEGANKYLGTEIAVSGAIAEKTRGLIPLRPAGELILKGKTRSIAVFEPIEVAGPRNFDAYKAAYELLAAGSVDAISAFEALNIDDPDDHLAVLHLGRLRRGEFGVRMMLKAK